MNSSTPDIRNPLLYSRNCYFHPERTATHTDTVIDHYRSSRHMVAYKRVPICQQCARERAAVNTSRVEPLEVASPEPSTAQPDTTGMAITASVDVPEEIKFAGERAEAVPAQSLPSPVLIDSNSDTPPTAKTSPAIHPLTDGVIYDEHLALALDEGQNSSNAWRLHDHVNHGLDVLAKRVDDVLIRAKVIESEVVEVGQ